MMSFLMGLAAGLEAVAGLFFLRFHRDTKDRLFLTFGIAFLLFAFGRGLQIAFAGREDDAVAYLPRLFGFVLIAAGVIDKNRKG